MFNRIVIASGPTVEPIDPVRFISNRSSGKTGYHLAEAANQRELGEVIFITGPTCYLPTKVKFISVETAEQMRDAVMQYYEDTNVMIMAAAVCDYKVARYQPRKIKKTEDRLLLELNRNPDILAELGAKKNSGQILVGFAAETDRVFEHAREKFRKKNLDLLVLNEISLENPAFGEEQNEVSLLDRHGFRNLEKMAKSSIAFHIWDQIIELYREKIHH